jgi:hypothetical protein
MISPAFFKFFIRITAMKRIFAFLILVAAASCIDPYNPNIKNKIKQDYQPAKFFPGKGH